MAILEGLLCRAGLFEKEFVEEGDEEEEEDPIVLKKEGRDVFMMDRCFAAEVD